MTHIASYHQSLGATLADDGIPLHYGSLKDEYHAALRASVLLDRSHEGRILLTGKDRFELINRMSTNKMVDMKRHEGRPTILTNATARILYRIMIYNRPEGLFMIAEPGQGDAVATYLNRNIFYGDDVKLLNITHQTSQFALHGKTADAIVSEIDSKLVQLPPLYSAEIDNAITTFTLVRRKPLVGQHWVIVCQREDSVDILKYVFNAGEKHGIQPAGSLTYNTLRIRSGRPAGRELSSNFIPLEVGLWDEVSFSKGCYTGQEIIARMESRQRLAKVMVKLDLASFVEAPNTIYDGDRSVGTLTSSVQSPDGEYFALAVIKTDNARPQTGLTVGEQRIPATVTGYAGQQPAFIDQ